MSTQRPLLTIAIPTWNRANYLAQCLESIYAEIRKLDDVLVEVLVSDNASTDETKRVVMNYIARDRQLVYIRNSSNLGWGPNFAQCFSQANGKYVLLIGDDDALVPDSLAKVVRLLLREEYRVVCVNSYGYDWDYLSERPSSLGGTHTFNNARSFLAKAGALVTLISSCIVHRESYQNLTQRTFADSDLAGLYFVLEALRAESCQAYLADYVVACKRNNSSSYVFSDVFVVQLWRILDEYYPLAPTNRELTPFRNRLLFSYYPYYLLQVLRERPAELERNQASFRKVFGHTWIYRLWLCPVFTSPRPLALAWALITVIIGRILDGDVSKGLAFLKRSIRKKIKP